MERPKGEGDGQVQVVTAEPITGSKSLQSLLSRSANCTINVLLFSPLVHPGTSLAPYWMVAAFEVCYVMFGQPLGRGSDTKVKYDIKDGIFRTLTWRAVDFHPSSLIINLLHDVLRGLGFIWLFAGCVLSGLGY